MNIPLAGSAVELLPIDERFEAELFAALDDERVWQWLPVARPDSAGFGKVFGFLLAENAAGRMHTWVTTSKDEGRVLGSSSYLALRPEHRGLEIGWTMVSPSAWGAGARSICTFRSSTICTLDLAREWGFSGFVRRGT